MTRDLRVGLYGLSREDLEQADFLGISPYEYSQRSYDDKPLTDDQKRSEWRRMFDERIDSHANDMKLWCDADNRLWLGWFRKDGCGRRWIILAAKVHYKSQTIVAIPLRRESDDVSWWRPWMACSVYDKIKAWRRLVPPGVF